MQTKIEVSIHWNVLAKYNLNPELWIIVKVCEVVGVF